MKMAQKLSLTLVASFLVFLPAMTSAETAVEAWVQRYSAACESDDYASKVVRDAAGNLIVAGYAYEGITGSDIVVIKYSGAGVPLWTNRYNGPGNGYDLANAAAVDGSNNVIVTGYSYGSGNSYEYVTIQYSGAGVPLWTNRYHGSGNRYDEAQAVIVDGNNNVIVTGYSYNGTNNDHVTIQYSSAGVPLWTNRYNGPANGDDEAYAVAVDGNNNVIVAGYSYNGTIYDYATIQYSSAGVPLWTNRYSGLGTGGGSVYAVAVDSGNNVIVTGASNNGTNRDYATIEYSSAGVPLWTNRYNGPGNGEDTATAIAVDGSNNVLVTGYSPGSGSANDYATIKYSSAGVPLWTNRYNGPGNYDDYATAVAVDASNNVIVTGYSFGNGSFFDYATVQYSSAGVPLWTKRYNGPGNSADHAQAVVVDSNNSVIVTGYSRGSGGSYDFATIEYSSAGAPIWTNCYNGPGNNNDYANAVAVDGNNNVIVTGRSYGGGSDYDYVTIQYSSTGAPLWTNRYNGPGNGGDVATAVAVDSSNNVIVTGSSFDAQGLSDYATIKYSSAGVPLWTNRYNGPLDGSDSANALAVDGNNNVIVTGCSPNPYSSGNYATIKYSSAGVPLWTNIYNGPANGDDQAQAVAVDGSNNVIVTGYSTGSGSAYDYATIKYSSAGVPLWVSRYNGPGNRDDKARAGAVDGSNDVIVTGYSYNGTNNDYVTIKYSGAGVPLWTNRHNGPDNGNASAYAVAVDGSNNVIATGGSGSDYATIQYSSAGAPLWTNRHNGSARAVAIDASNNVVVTGYSPGSGGFYDYATIKYSSAGVPLWTNRYNGPANGDDQPQTRACLAIGPDGAVVVTGTSDGNFSDGSSTYDFATVKYISVTPPAITSQPTRCTRNAGTSASFSVTATGTEPLHYQWMNDGTNSLTDGGKVSGAMTAMLTLSAVTTNEAARYCVVVTNAAGSATSSNAELTVIPVLRFDTSPSGLHWTTNGFLLTLVDLPGQGSVTIYASTNLIDWEILLTNPSATGVLQFIDTEATNWSMRFYRAYEQW
jgi:uncharacterized delta-60 repeat protein